MHKTGGVWTAVRKSWFYCIVPICGCRPSPQPSTPLISQMFVFYMTDWCCCCDVLHNTWGRWMWRLMETHDLPDWVHVHLTGFHNLRNGRWVVCLTLNQMALISWAHSSCAHLAAMWCCATACACRLGRQLFPPCTPRWLIATCKIDQANATGKTAWKI